MPVRVRAGIGVAVVFAALLAAFVWMAWRSSGQQRRIASLESELAEARSRAAQPVHVPPPAVVMEPSVPLPAAPTTKTEKADTRPTLSAEVEELGARLSEANAAVARMQGRVNELETQVLSLSADRARLANSESAAQDRTASLDRKVEEANTQRSTREKRIRDLETEVARLRTRDSAGDKKQSEVAGIARELQELSQRQQVYVANILRRYREVTDLLRSLPSAGEFARNSGGSGPEMARIQTAISMADEDVRQLKDLNVRLGRTQKEIARIDGVAP